jgi:hypothetical protein
MYATYSQMVEISNLNKDCVVLVSRKIGSVLMLYTPDVRWDLYYTFSNNTEFLIRNLNIPQNRWNYVDMYGLICRYQGIVMYFGEDAIIDIATKVSENMGLELVLV